MYKCSMYVHVCTYVCTIYYYHCTACSCGCQMPIYGIQPITIYIYIYIYIYKYMYMNVLRMCLCLHVCEVNGHNAIIGERI